MRAIGIKLLRGFTVVWIGLASIVILAGMGGIWMSEGFGRVQEVFSPFNFINFAAILLTLSPAFGARVLADKLERSAEAEEHESLDASIKLIQDYGAAMEAAANTVAVDASRLPAPKAEIKAAIMRVLRSGEHKPMREALKTGYLDLSMFQPGVGDEPIRMLPIPDEIPDASDQDAILAAAKAIAAAGGEHQRWMKIVSEEQNQSVEELTQAGFWND